MEMDTVLNRASVRAQNQEEANISFRWAFGAQIKTDHDKLMSITQDTTLHTGDQLKMVLEPQKPCFVYVLHQGPQGEIRWLFPTARQAFDTDYRPKQRYDIPQGEAWFRLNDQVGRETFYLLAATQRLSELEALLEAYTTTPSPEQAAVADQIIVHIRELRKRHRQATTVAERPVPIAGNLRTPRGEALGELAVEINAHDFYSKTYTIEHR
jgi:hypothetical protein